MKLCDAFPALRCADCPFGFIDFDSPCPEAENRKGVQALLQDVIDKALFIQENL